MNRPNVRSTSLERTGVRRIERQRLPDWSVPAGNATTARQPRARQPRGQAPTHSRLIPAISHVPGAVWDVAAELAASRHRTAQPVRLPWRIVTYRGRRLGPCAVLGDDKPSGDRASAVRLRRDRSAAARGGSTDRRGRRPSRCPHPQHKRASAESIDRQSLWPFAAMTAQQTVAARYRSPSWRAWDAARSR